MPRDILFLAEYSHRALQFKNLLTEMGYDNRLFSDPFEAISFGEKEEPACVICEARLGSRNCVQVAHLVKTHPTLGHLPVILLAVNEVEASRFEDSDLIDDKISFPLNRIALLHTIRRWQEMHIPSDHLRLPVNSITNPKMLAAFRNGIRQGRVKLHNFCRFIYKLSEGKRSGILTLQDNGTHIVLAIRKGQIVNVLSDYLEDNTLGHFLAKNDLLPRDQIGTIYKEAKNRKVLLGEFLIRANLFEDTEMQRLINLHKLQKCSNILSDWYGAYYCFWPWEIGDECCEISPYSLRNFVKDIVFKDAPPDLLLKLFTRNGKIEEPIRIKPSFLDIIQDFELSEKELAYAQWIENRSISELKTGDSEFLAPSLRLAYFLILVKAADFSFDVPEHQEEITDAFMIRPDEPAAEDTTVEIIGQHGPRTIEFEVFKKPEPTEEPDTEKQPAAVMEPASITIEESEMEPVLEILQEDDEPVTRIIMMEELKASLETTAPKRSGLPPKPMKSMFNTQKSKKAKNADQQPEPEQPPRPTTFEPDVVNVGLLSLTHDLIDSQNYSEARNSLSKIMVTAPDDDLLDAMWMWCNYHLSGRANLNDFVRAKQSFINASEMYPSDFVPWKYLGDIYLHERKFRQAIQSYDRALELDPENPLIIEKKTMANVQLEKITSEARQVMSAAAKHS